jgi:hypothetical protein
MRVRTTAVSLLPLTLAACDLADLLGNDELNLSGQNAFVYLQSDPARAQSPNVSAVMQIVEWEAEGGSALDDPARFEPDTEVVDFLQSTSRARRNVRTEAFTLMDFGLFTEPASGNGNKMVLEAPDLSSLRNEYMVPRLDAVPVRNQGGRGTCAAFTGIGQLEYAVLSQHPELGTIDLSEQRFYFNSKPECQASGCGPSAAGSWYGTGFAESAASSDLDIPLEQDCPYNPFQTDNELQVPLDAGCSRGAVRVVEYELVYQPAEIIRVLEEQGVPVPYASPLSENYFSNNGLITLAAAGTGGSGMHASGHAYLIVGYKLLPNMPEEGGMCFVIKNSWGTGWGAGGFSCMTLAWMQEWNYGYALDQPIAVSMEVREDILSGLPDDDDSVPDFVDEETYDDETVDHDELDDEVPIPDPEPVPPEIVWVDAVLAGPDGRFYRAEYADLADGTMQIRGDVRGDNRLTNPTTVTRTGSLLVFDGDEVGEVNGNDITLCTGRFDLICSLRYDRGDNQLYIEFLYDEYRRVENLPNDEWQSLLSLPNGASIEVVRPDNILDALLSPLFVRLGGRANRNSPIRLAVNRRLEVTVMDEAIGSLRPDRLSFCTGNYRSRCSMFVGRDGLLVLPGWGGL